MKMSKKLLASQVNSVRPYKSRSKRPCDFCRRRKTCCIIEKSTPCMACAQFNKGVCTFIEKPLKRSKRDSFPGKERASKRRMSRKEMELEIYDDESSPSMVHDSPVLEFPSEIRANPRMQNSCGLSPQASSWQQVMDPSRSHSTGSLHSQNLGSSSYARGILYSQPMDQASTQDSQPLHQELVEEYKLYAMQQQQQQQIGGQTQNTLSRQSSYAAKDLDHFDGHLPSQHAHSIPYYSYSAVEPPPSLDNSEFVSSASGSISSTRLSTGGWLPQTLETTVSSCDNAESADGSELDHSVGSRLLPTQQTQPFQLGLPPFYYCQDTYGSFNNGGFFGGASAVPAQGGTYAPK